ncbi:cyclic nucleotide-binding domain-containing protein [Actinacidiphila sp. ITFR-21]|uniref:cyclic nucleotide-binding domain-containing protein n=1 Tax=Actinacidiphila sp. ITFR-21 TaxID=3075199 RepID=UPI00288B7900|nr:cyclic nucleotide-binding domain-containing protein [Streptomyces sp. ITFR-21]WNI19448.1 cyclic nucleotide-binding domain-containing protein [Streptomyces sp. ITFR-21]
MTSRLMTMTARLDTLSDEHRERLMALAHEVRYAAGARLFEERERADRFWLIREGDVALELRVPGRPAAVIENLGQGSLLGWSWLFPPRRWHMSAKALTGVRAWEFDAAEVRRLCEEDPRFGYVFVLACAEVIGHRLEDARTRLLDLYGPYGSGLPR